MAQKGEEHKLGWLLLLHLRNQGRRSMCTWACICTHLTSGASACSSLATPCSTGCGYVRLPQQLHEQHALLYILSWAYSVCSFSSAVSAARRTLSCSILCFLFSSVVCGVLRRSLSEHDGAISDEPRNFTLRTCGSIITYPLRLR